MKKLVAILLITTLNTAHAGFFGLFGDDDEKKTPESIDMPQMSKPSPDSYAQVSNTAAKSLEDIETLIAQKKPREALALAKSVLDEIRTKVGINTKAKFREKIETRNILSNGDLQTPFGNLTNSQKEEIAKIVALHKDGFYLDLLNYSKRVELAYQKARLEILKEKGTLGSRDIESITQSIVKLVNIPILISDSNALEAFLLFDSDVAQIEHIEMFNHEIEDYFLVTLNKSQEEFWAAAEKNRSERMKEHLEPIKHIDNEYFKRCQDESIRYRRIYATAGLGGFLGIYDKVNSDFPISADEAKQICKQGQKYRTCVIGLLEETNLKGVESTYKFKRSVPKLTYTLEQAKELCQSAR